ncbi:hypothetical protein AC578_245 [Pseudocercospora eumusae]|uniref:C2H2-type domain-containing protein n=1 Tax=Pseudocercospora eumusae TaxID=321146 RepID=A0A139HIR0_9PEZI|nr:hypothetical protein AC578_245 [Pseudocercospora eumusae]KXT02294.1 hypothetical protein AC578_245 [Pseudocercospora eumusae]
MAMEIIDLRGSDASKADMKPPVPASVDRRLKERITCDQCGREYSHHSHLRRHLLSHTGDKPNACTFPGCDYRTIQKVALEAHRRSKNHLVSPDVWTCYRPQGCGKKFPDPSSFFMHACCSPEDFSTFHVNMRENYRKHGLLYPTTKDTTEKSSSSIRNASARPVSPVTKSFQDEYASDGSAVNCMGDCMDDDGSYRHFICGSDAGRYDCRWCEQPFGSHARWLKHEKDECVVKLQAKEQVYDSAQSERECAGNCADENMLHRHQKSDEKWLLGTLQEPIPPVWRDYGRRECYRSHGGCGKSFKTLGGFERHSCVSKSKDPQGFMMVMLDLTKRGTQHTPKKIGRPRTSLHGTNADQATGPPRQLLAKASETGVSEAELVFAAIDAMTPPSAEVQQLLLRLARQHT